VENPAGIFNQDNWSLPFLRLGLVPPDSISPQCGKALHLMGDGVAYYLELIRIAGEPSVEEMAAFTEVLESRRSEVEHVVRRENGSYGWPEEGDARLSQIWSRLWDEIRKAASDEVWARIVGLSG